MSKTRKEGYYWVRTDKKWYVMEWIVWDKDYRFEAGGYWMSTGSDIEWYDSDFKEINETRLIEPDKQTT